MKATKRIIAVALAVMVLALMIPFAASAATNYTANITGKAGYTITVYRIATYNGSAYAAGSVDSSIASEITKSTGIVPADLLTACENAKNAGKSTGTQSGSALTFGTDGKTTFTTTTPGIYYATVTATPQGVSVKKTGGCVFYLSDAKDASGNSMAIQNINMSAKIEDGTVSVSKEIVGGDMGNNYQTTEHVGDDVTFKLTASVTGTKDEYLTSYVIHDAMSHGLSFNGVDSVTLNGTTTLTFGTDYTVTATNQDDITIALTEAYLNNAKKETGDNGFYAASNVIVTMKAKLNDNAVHGRTTDDDATAYTNAVANYNKDSLSYTNKLNVSSTVEGTTVHVYTFDVDIYKVDATDDTKKLDGATFTLTMGDKTYTATTANGGKASFTGLKKGTYTLKETAAPNGYNLNNTEYTVTIGADGAITSQQYDATLKGVKIGDTPVVMPATGGPGTMMFTIIGASLIACAGILFIIIMRKKKSSK